jgi:hypothetical protein
VAGPEWYAQGVDVVGTRDQIEVLSVVGVLCSGNLTKAHLFQFEKDTTSHPPRSFKATSLWSTEIWPQGARRTGFAVGDLCNDSREEILYLTEPLDIVEITEARVIYDNAELQRPEPTPFAFLDYRRRNHHAAYRETLDYRPFSGLRFYTQRMLVGKTGDEYGVHQDPALGTSGKGCVVWAEGGTPPYTISLVSGRLPGGLGWSKLRTGVVPYGEMFFVAGVPLETGIQRFRLRVTDSRQPTPRVHEQDFWLTVEFGVPPSETPSSPKIVGGGFDSVYLRVNQPSNVTVRAMVTDPDFDATHVNLLDETGAQTAQLFDNGNPSNGDLVAGDGTFSALLAGVNYTTTGPRNFRMIAADATGFQSLPWPYLVVDGGPGEEDPSFHEVADLGSQDANNTPVVTQVEFVPDSVPAAETRDAAVALPLTVKVDRKGLKAKQIKVRVLHPLTSYVYETVYDVPAAQQYADSHAFTTNALPSGQFGWGYYTLNAQLIVEDTQSAQFVSNWWPRLRVHP